MNISISVAKAINLSEYEKLITEKERNDYFVHMQEYFLSIQKTTGVKYLYLEHKLSDTQIEYIFDAEKDSFGEIDNNSTPNAHLSPQSFHTAVESYSMWGTLITGYSPIISKKGEIIGTVGTDIDVSFFYQALVYNLLSILLYTGGMIALFCFLIYYTLSQEINERKLAQEQLTQSSHALRNLLNNAGQGFLSFENSLRIDSEYSNECLKIFGHEIRCHRFPDLIFPDDKVQQDFLAEILPIILQETNDSKRTMLLSLLPEEITLNERFIHLEFRLIQTKHYERTLAFMAILTDITDKRSLERQMEDDRKTLKMIVNVIAERNNFMMCIYDYKDFCHSGIPELLSESTSTQEMLYNYFREIHTFKGNFSQFEMPHLTNQLHDLESKLSELRKEPINAETRAKLVSLLSDTPLMDWLDQELTIIHKTLGDWFFNEDSVVIIDESKLIELEGLIKEKFPSDEGESLILEIRKLRYKPFSELLKPYQAYVSNLSEQLEKTVHPLIIEGEELRVNLSDYHPFGKTLVHVFRNALDHGIEPSDERINQGKKEYGQIKCLVKREGNSLVLTISDDGQGINVNTLREKSIAKGMHDRETAYQLPDEKILPYIFYDNFSTNTVTTELSGHGIGLSAVKHELDQLGGSIKVMTKLHDGTTFRFYLPIIE